MLKELIELTQTEDYDHDGSVSVIGAKWQNGNADLEVYLGVNVGSGDPVQVWKLLCESEREHNIISGWDFRLEVSDKHILLWPHIEETWTLWFTGQHNEGFSVIGELWHTHHNLVSNWFPFSRFFNYTHDFLSLVSGGHGKLAEGPKPLITEYQKVMEKHGFKTSVTSHPPRYFNGEAWVSPGNLVALLAGKSYVIASSIEASRAN